MANQNQVITRGYDTGIKSVFWPMIKRTPAYARLGLTMAREPAIPHRYKLMLYGTIFYQVSPLHLVVTPIPVVGQIDCPILLLLSIRQMAEHCPPAVFRRCLQQSKLDPLLFEQDMKAILEIGSNTKSRVRTDANLAGRVVRSMGLRSLARMIVSMEKPRKRYLSSGAKSRCHIKAAI